MRAERLANRTFFPYPCRSGNVVFAIMPASVDPPHYVAFDTATNQSYCSCPFQPKPCLHAQALRLFFAREGETAFDVLENVPDWVHAFLHTQPSFQKPSNQKPETFKPETLQQETRLERTRLGFEDLETWLLDTLRRGVATAVSEDPDFFKNIAARLADASMRGLSRSIRTLEALPADHPDWPERIAAVLADAALALHAFRRRNHLPEPLLRDLEAVVGISPKKEAVRAEGEILRDAWAVVGMAEEQVEDQLRQRRTWLLGAGSGRFALLLEYAFGEPEFLPGFKPGFVLEGDLVFYPSAWPLRALASDEIKILPQTLENLPGFEKIGDMVRTCAAAFGLQPWLSVFPAVLLNATPFYHKNRFGIADRAGKQIPLANPESDCWSLIALSSGHPITVFGEWNGETLTARSAIADERFITL